ncbi:hypothetical protein DM02DRAFT_685393 [Periconia macrospinosa]|uniref:Rhodopsin domain-containing protein n=1 Tax=Periconia macrospinosa TaxID=97972 RepID=A0A2V1E4T3_9PLEO|nr:hypothetical protein DM02DRAFT_685393 [Periconia macrospinosa]
MVAHSVSAPNENQGPLLNRVSVAVYSVSVVFIALRFLTRGWIVRKYGLDDLLVGVAVVLGAVQTATISLEVKYGLGKHVQEIDIPDYNLILKFKWVNMMVYYIANWSVKMSILALYHRIGVGHKGLPWMLQSKVVIMIAGVITAFTTAVFFAELLACQPISATWKVESKVRSCMDMSTFYTIQASINVAVDLLLLVFPMPLLRILNIDKRKKIALVLIFSIGIIPLVASVIRLVEIVVVSHMDAMAKLSEDPSWRWAWVPVWGQIEVDVGIVAASLPSLSPLLKKFWSGVSTQLYTTHPQHSTLIELQPPSTHSGRTLSTIENKIRPESVQSEGTELDEFVDLEAFPSTPSTPRFHLVNGRIEENVTQAAASGY